MSAMAPRIALIGTQRNSWREKFPTQNWSCSKAKATTTWRLVQRQRTGRSDNLSDNCQTQKGGRNDALNRLAPLSAPRLRRRRCTKRRCRAVAEIDVGAILAEKLLFLRRPEHHGARVHAGVGDDHFRRRCPMRVNRSKRKETDGGAEND